MKTMAEKMSAAAPAADAEIETAARCAASALTFLPEEKRRAAAQRLMELVAPPKMPQRGGPVLDNVYALFKDGQRDWTAKEVLKALENKGQNVEPKKVYSALTYLKDMKIIRRVGYGRYLVEGGGLLITHERGGD